MAVERTMGKLAPTPSTEDDAEGSDSFFIEVAPLNTKAIKQ
jgi:hypothetical protein